jgi:hypothetical protein
MGCIFPTTEHVCPDGSVVDYQTDCTSYTKEIPVLNITPTMSIKIQDGLTNYVAVNGEINATIHLKSDETATASLSRFSNEGTQNYQLIYLSFEEKKRHAVLVPVSMDYYKFTIIAPNTPGEYLFSIGKRNQSTQTTLGQYNLTVICPVNNETMAYAIAAAHMDSKIPDNFGYDVMYVYRTKRNWTIVEAEAHETEDSWEVFLKVKYDRCGIDHDYNNCVSGYTVTGRYVIDRQTGQIIG